MAPVASLAQRTSRQFELAEQARRGDLEATQELLGQLSPTIGRVVAGVIGASHADFDDVAQQSLIAFVGALQHYRGECPPAGYASRIAFRVALRFRKQRNIELARLGKLSRLSPPDETAPSPLEVNGRERRRTLLRELLGKLPEEQAEALALRVALGWSLQEIADATETPANTVRSRLRLAKEAMRKRIANNPLLADELEVAK